MLQCANFLSVGSFEISRSTPSCRFLDLLATYPNVIRAFHLHGNQYLLQFNHRLKFG